MKLPCILAVSVQNELKHHTTLGTHGNDLRQLFLSLSKNTQGGLLMKDPQIHWQQPSPFGLKVNL